MRVRGAAALCATGMIAVGALSASADASAGREVHVTASPRVHAPVEAVRTCYAQSDHDAFGSVISQNWEPSFDVYDDQAADDFVLSRPCRRPVIDIDGSYGEGTGPADSFNVTIYRDGRHGPGKVFRYLDAVGYVDTCQEMGCARIGLGKRLTAGHWWISVQANLSYSETGSMWSWWTNLTTRHAAARWQNPPDGFGTGCTTYTKLVTCLGEDSGIGGDLSFTISSS